jgi:hypothetical protein
MYINRGLTAVQETIGTTFRTAATAGTPTTAGTPETLETPLERIYRTKSLLVTSLIELSYTKVTSNEITILFPTLQIYSHARISKEMLPFISKIQFICIVVSDLVLCMTSYQQPYIFFINKFLTS